MTTQQADAILYTAAAGHLAPDTDIEVKRVLCRSFPQVFAICCYQVSDKSADVHLQANQPAVVVTYSTRSACRLWGSVSHHAWQLYMSTWVGVVDGGGCS
jgi:hypothetical protein